MSSFPDSRDGSLRSTGENDSAYVSIPLAQDAVRFGGVVHISVPMAQLVQKYISAPANDPTTSKTDQS